MNAITNACTLAAITLVGVALAAVSPVIMVVLCLDVGERCDGKPDWWFAGRGM